MSFNSIVSRLVRHRTARLEKKITALRRNKTRAAEWLAILRKRKLYQHIRWTKEQTAAFAQFWLENYGKKIPDRWHKLYEASSGRFAVDYIPEILYTTKIEPTMNDYRYADVLEDKFLVETLCGGLPCIAPKSVVLCSAGRLYGQDRAALTRDEAVRLICGRGDLFLKPTTGSSSGRGVTLLPTLSASEAEKLLRQSGPDFVIQERIRQHPVLEALNPSSVNTIRITTYVLDGQVRHIPICLRIGRSGRAVDNIHAGGIGVGVRDDGSLLPVGYELGYGDKTVSHREHPDSRVRFDVVSLPSMDTVIQSAYQLHGRFPHTGIISWDFSVDPAGTPVFIEANLSGQGIWFSQMIHGKGPFGEDTKAILKLLK